MAHASSARKRVRQNAKRRLRNRRRKAGIREGVRAYQAALEAGQTDQAADRLKEVYRRLDKTAAKGTIHRKTAARRKSRLAKRLNKVAAE